MTITGIARWKLFSPFLFLRLRYAERTTYGCVALGAAAIAAGGYWLLPQKPSLLGVNGLFEDLKIFVTILFPFFVGALVAVATYQRPGLDEKPTGGQVKLCRRNAPVIYLTRRQFVCLIFGYCAGTSVIIFVGIMFAKALAPWLISGAPQILPFIRLVAVGLIAAVFAHMLIITFWGLYYLTDRLHEAPMDKKPS